MWCRVDRAREQMVVYGRLRMSDSPGSTNSVQRRPGAQVAGWLCLLAALGGGHLSAESGRRSPGRVDRPAWSRCQSGQAGPQARHDQPADGRGVAGPYPWLRPGDYRFRGLRADRGRVCADDAATGMGRCQADPGRPHRIHVADRRHGDLRCDRDRHARPRGRRQASPVGGDHRHRFPAETPWRSLPSPISAPGSG